ncbi:SAP domain-containing protein [bacterium]|nr:SAP domain-containing protein [bacterium]
MEDQKDVIMRIEDMTVKELRILAKQKGCPLNGLSLKAEIQEKLLEFLQTETASVPSSAQIKLFSEESTPCETPLRTTSKLACLPLLVDEFLYMWEGGFICHPAVMSEMARETGVELETRAYHASPELLWDIVAQIPGDVRLHLDEPSSMLTSGWAASFQSLVRIEVDTSERKEELIRLIKQTHQRFDSELFIEVGSVPSSDPLVVESDAEWTVLKSNGFNRMKKIDSAIGAIAVSSYVERLMLVQRRLNSSIPQLGWLGSAIFETDIWRQRLTKEFDTGSVEHLRFFAEGAKNCINLECEWKFDIRDELSAWRNGEDNFPALWSRFALDLSEEVRNAIEKDMCRGLIRDVMIEHGGHLTPWLIYILLLWKHKGIRNRSSNASQSLLHTLIDFVDGDIVNGQTAVTIGAYHGWHMGYQLCMASPVNWTRVYGGNSYWWSLKLSSKALAPIASALINQSEFRSENQGQWRIPLSGECSLVLQANGVVRMVDVDISELRHICQTESSDLAGIRAFLPLLPGALESMTKNGGYSLGEKKLEELIRDVASALKSDDERGSKRRFVKMLLAGWRNTNHQKDE